MRLLLIISGSIAVKKCPIILKKLISKKCDLIVVNKIDKKNKVFGLDYNQVTLVSHNEIKKLKKMTKINIAKILVNKIINIFEYGEKSEYL